MKWRRAVASVQLHMRMSVRTMNQSVRQRKRPSLQGSESSVPFKGYTADLCLESQKRSFGWSVIRNQAVTSSDRQTWHISKRTALTRFVHAHAKLPVVMDRLHSGVGGVRVRGGHGAGGVELMLRVEKVKGVSHQIEAASKLYIAERGLHVPRLWLKVSLLVSLGKERGPACRPQRKRA